MDLRYRFTRVIFAGRRNEGTALFGAGTSLREAKFEYVLPDSRPNFELSVEESSDVGIVPAIALGMGTGKTN